MPIYVFDCKHCSHQFEKIVRQMDGNPVCPECGSETEKVIARVSPFVWGKGGSWA